MLGMARVAVAATLICWPCTASFWPAWRQIIAAVSPVKPTVWRCRYKVIVGDLEDLELAARGQRVQLVVSNSHAAGTASTFGRAADARRLSAV